MIGRRPTLLAALTSLVLLVSGSDTGAEDLVTFFTRGLQAREAGDHQAYHDNMEAALELEPSHPVVKHHLARALAQTGRHAEALRWLVAALAMGVPNDIAADPWLEPLRNAPGWEKALEQANLTAGHRGAGRIGFELKEFDLLPEGIAHDPVTDSFFLSSVRKRKIVRRWPDGRTEDFVPTAGDGFLSGLGIEVDDEARRLWACGAFDDAWTEREEGETLASGLWCWSLEDGSLLGRWGAPPDSLAHNYNDLTLHPDGRVFVTDAAAGTVLVLHPGAGALEALAEAGTWQGPNGIALDADGRHLYFSEWGRGLRVLDLETLDHARIAHAADIASVGVDGLIYHDGALLAVQNYAGLDRVARFRLDESRRRIIGCEVLEARHPRMDDPTTAVIAHGDLWFIANSHIASYARQTGLGTHEEMGDVLILRVEL